jgi:N-acetylglucosaminyldiphosphoundecaprenol N-acetyl-beta-D-mannosaminyltransferase
MPKANILGVLIDKININEILEKVDSFLKDGKKHYIVTPNPEMVAEAQKDSEFKNILNQADIAIPDGFGLILASWWLRDRIKKRVTGVDLVWRLAEKIEKTDHKLFLLGGEGNVAEEAAAKLKVKYPELKIVGAEMGHWDIGKSGNWENKDLNSRINQAKPDILLVAFGHGKQEKWIYHNLPKLESVKVAIGVGGTLNYISGKVKRAPNILRHLGLEWCWRLGKEPWRWKRIITAVIIFPWLVLKNKKNQ